MNILVFDFIKKKNRVIPENTTRQMVFDYFTAATGFIDIIKYNNTELLLMQDILNFNNYTVERAIEYIQPSCSDLMVHCRWEYKMIPCTDLFHSSQSYHGSACTFNKSSSARYFEIFGGLSMAIAPPKNTMFSKDFAEGVKVILHPPEDFPSYTSIEKIIPHRFITNIMLNTMEYFCSDGMERLTPAQRNCFYTFENKLR